MNTRDIFFKTLLISIITTRAYIISIPFIIRDPAVLQSLINDPYHHYHIGLLLIFLSYLLRHHRQIKWLLPVGLGIFLEELPVILDDLGLHTLKFYQNGWDVVIVFVLILIVYGITNSVNSLWEIKRVVRKDEYGKK